LLASGASQKTTATRLGLAENTVMRWMKDESFRARVDAARQNGHDPDPRSALRAGLHATLADGITPDHKTRIASARALAQLDAEQPPVSEPQLFCVRLKPDGSMEQVWGTPLPPDFRVPAAFTLSVEDGAFPEGERDPDGWQ